MDKLEPPQAFSFDDSVSHSWKLWLKNFDFYLAATKKDTKDNKIKTSKKEEKYMRLLTLNLAMK